MSPVLGVLVAMALMAMLSALLATCGVIAGALAFAPSDEVQGATDSRLAHHEPKQEPAVFVETERDQGGSTSRTPVR